MWTHPGKKLLFMGDEFAQEKEWSHDHALDWHLLADPSHRGMQNLVRDLNRLYGTTHALHALDCEPAGFEWVESGDAAQSVLAYLRRGSTGSHPVLVVCNFTPIVRHNYLVGVPEGGRWAERLNTDSHAYGGSNVGNAGGADALPRPCHGRPFSLEIALPPLATLVFEHVSA
jgi:1,4-alpha-glucan branching enzyme